MDFFVGSGTLAHAAWMPEIEDTVRRRVVLVQLPEPLDEEDEKQRLRRGGKRRREENPMFS